MGTRGRRRFGTAVGLFVAVTLGSAFLVEAGNPPSITLNPNRGRGGTHVTVNGSHFPHSDLFATAIYIYWDWGLSTEKLIANGTTARDNTFSITFTVPRGQGRFGANPVHACVPTTNGSTACHPGDTTAHADATFTIPKSHVTINPTHGRTGMRAVANGFDYFPVNPFELTWDPAGSNKNLGSGRTDSSGRITLSFTVPDVAAGTYLIRGCTTTRTACAKNDTHTDTFVVTSPTLDVNPNQGMAGDKIATSGKNYWPQCELHLYLGTSSNPTQHELAPGVAKSTSQGGTFAYSEKLPDVPAGPYLITAKTVRGVDFCPVVDVVQHGFTVVATPTPTPTPAPTRTPAPTSTARPTDTPRPTPTPDHTAAPTPTEKPTEKPTAKPTEKPSETPGESPTSIPSETVSPPAESASPSLELTPPPTAVPATEPPPTEGPPPATQTPPPPERTAEPTSAPSPSSIPPPVRSVAWPDSVKGPADVIVDPGVAGGGLLLSLLIALLVPFPGTLFNKTVEANQEEITDWFERLKRG